MNTVERYEELLGRFDEIFNEDEGMAAEYVLEYWPEIRELLKAIWKEEGKEGKPDLSLVASDARNNGFFIENFLGDADIALHNGKYWQERKEFNEDQLNEFTAGRDPLLYDNCRQAVAECIRELEGMDAAMDYIDQWQKEDPDSTYPDAVKINLYFFNDDLQKAKAIADHYLGLEHTGSTEHYFLYDMMKNVYEELKDAESLKKLLQLQLDAAEKKKDETLEQIAMVARIYAARMIQERIPEEIADFHERFLELIPDDNEALRVMGMCMINSLQKLPETERRKDEILKSVHREALSAELERTKAQKRADETGRYETLEQLISVIDEDEMNEIAEALNIRNTDPSSLAKRLMTAGAFRNLFICMHDDAIGVLRSVINDPKTIVNMDEAAVLSWEIPLCVRITKDFRVLLADDFVQQFQKLDTPAFDAQRKQSCWVMDCFFMAYKCYGVMKDSEFLKMVSVNSSGLSMKDIRKIRQSLPSERKFCRMESGYIFDEDFGKGKEYIRQYTSIRKKYPFTLPEVGEISGLYIYGYPHTLPAYLSIKEYLYSIFGPEKIKEAILTLHELFDMISTDAEMTEVLKVFMDHFEISLNADPKKAAELIIALVNSTRRWDLSGNSPHELAGKNR